MPTTDTPLRYPGGKSQLTPFVLDVMRANNLMQCIYCEPFAGGAGIACRLMLTGAVSEIWINDIDASIYAFWHSVLNTPDELCRWIEKTPLTIKEWKRQRAVQQDNAASIFQLGCSTLFLNRTNRSGILKGGVIGGLEQIGDYPLSCRFNRLDLVRKIQRLAIYKDQIHLSRMDAEIYMKSVVPKLPNHSLVNIDPPYFGKGPGLYTSFYKPKDHAALSRVVRSTKKPWMLTYDDAPEILELYAGMPRLLKELNYTAQVKRIGIELLVMSKKLNWPDSVDKEQLLLAA
jgi:DNA adenine methylase